MKNGPTQALKSASRCGATGSRSSGPDEGRAPAGLSSQGSASAVACPVSKVLSAEASVPPLKPPRNEKQAFTPVQASPRAWKCLTSIHAPRSDGTESKPQHGMMRVPSAAACAWWRSISPRTHGVSPVMST